MKPENIGFACNVIKDEMTRIYLLEGTAKQLHATCKEEIKKHQVSSAPAQPRERGKRVTLRYDDGTNER